MNNSNLHFSIIDSFLTAQRPPSVDSLATTFNTNRQSMVGALSALADYHGVVLHPTTREVLVCHPFSAVPTTFVVRSKGKKWWGNCAWCSLGLVHLVGGTATIETRLGGIDDSISIRIENGKLLDDQYVIHFPIPMVEAWDSVTYTCSLMLAFRSEHDVNDWCVLRGLPRGDVRPIAQIWEFASEWYSRHADKNWTKWSISDATQLFKKHQLTHPVWAMPDSKDHF
jgi:Alkylmercury lyase